MDTPSSWPQDDEVPRRVAPAEMVKAHVSRLVRKSGVRNRLELSVHAVKHSLRLHLEKRVLFHAAP